MNIMVIYDQEKEAGVASWRNLKISSTAERLQYCQVSTMDF